MYLTYMKSPLNFHFFVNLDTDVPESGEFPIPSVEELLFSDVEAQSWQSHPRSWTLLTVPLPNANSFKIGSDSPARLVLSSVNNSDKSD